MQFDHVGIKGMTLFNGIDRRIDKEGDFDLGVMQTLDRVTDGIAIADDIQTAFGGHFGTVLGYQCGAMGFQFADYVDDVGIDRALEVDRQRRGGDDLFGIIVVDMAAVLTQVDGDLVCPVLCTDAECHQGVGIVDLACFAQDGDMVDIDAECHRFLNCVWHRIPP